METNFPDWAKIMRVGTWGLSYKDLTLTPEQADGRALAKKAMGINTVVSFGYHFRWDWIVHFDQIREASRLSVDACHRHGIKYVEHHSACFVTRLKNRTKEEFAYLEDKLGNHTVPEPLGFDAVVKYNGEYLNDWFVINSTTGLPDYWHGYRGLAFCPNNPAYQKNYFAYLEDFLNYTRADGIMSDDVTMGTSYNACTCKHCRMLFKEKTGLDLPDSAGLLSWQETNSPEFRQWANFRAESVRMHYERVNALIDKLGRPLLHTACACGITSPSAAGTFDRQKTYNTTFMEIVHCMHDYYSWRNILPDLRTYRAIAREKDNPSFAIIYPLPTGGEQFFTSAFCRMEDHSVWLSPNVGHHSPQGDAIDNSWFLWEEKHEFLFNTKDTFVHVGVLFSDDTRRYYRGIHRDYYTYEFTGWCQALQAEGVDFDIVLSEEIEHGKMDKYRLLLVPNAGCLSEIQSQRLSEFVSNGGKIIASHETSLFDEKGNIRNNFVLADCLGIDYIKTVSDEHYPLQARKGDDSFLQNIKGLVPHTKPQVKITPRNETEVVATSYTDGGGLQGGCIPAITRHRHGQGEAVYFSGKPGLHSYQSETRANSWDGEEPNRFLDYRIPEWGMVIGNAAKVLAAPFPITLTGVNEGVVFRAYQLRDGSLAVHILNASGSIIPHKTLIPKRYNVDYPPITSEGSEVVIHVNLDKEITSARLYTPEHERDILLDVRKADGIFMVSIKPEQLISYGVVLMK
jgi:hypothetical protein